MDDEQLLREAQDAIKAPANSQMGGLLRKLFGPRKWIYGHDAVSTTTKKMNPDPLRQNTLSGLMTEMTTFTQLSYDRLVRYNDYDAEDEGSPEIAAALSLYATEATPQDVRHKRVVWVQSDDKDAEKKLNNMVERLGLEEKSWGYARNLAKYGDMFLLNLFDTRDETFLLSKAQCIRSRLPF